MDRWRRPCPEPVPPNDDGLRNTRSREALHRSDHDAPQGSIASSLVGDRQSGGPPSRACIELGVRKTPETGSGSSGTKGASREASAAILPFRIDPFSLGTVACTAMNCSVALCKILVQLRDPAGSGDRDRHSLGPNHQAGLEAGAVRSEMPATVPSRLDAQGPSRRIAAERDRGYARASSTCPAIAGRRPGSEERFEAGRVVPRDPEGTPPLGADRGGRVAVDHTSSAFAFGELAPARNREQFYRLGVA